MMTTASPKEVLKALNERLFALCMECDDARFVQERLELFTETLDLLIDVKIFHAKSVVQPSEPPVELTDDDIVDANFDDLQMRRWCRQFVWSLIEEQRFVDLIRTAQSPVEPSDARRIEHVGPKVVADSSAARQLIERKAKAFDMLRDLCGYIENGTDTSVRILQDDATKDWCLRIGTGKGIGNSARAFSGKSLFEIIERAHAKECASEESKS